MRCTLLSMNYSLGPLVSSFSIFVLEALIIFLLSLIVLGTTQLISDLSK